MRRGTIVRLSVVRSGRIEISRAEGVRESWPTCTLLECGDLHVLVDLAHPGEDPGILVSALREKGLEPGHIQAVVFTHLHPDHIGHKDLFPDALFVFHEAERLAFYFEPDRTMRLTTSALLDLAPGTFGFPVRTTEWPPLTGLGGRVYVRHFPGHTPGSLVVFACVGGRVHALAGDVILGREHFVHRIPPGSSWKPDLIPDQMSLIAERADVIVPGHGPPFPCGEAVTGAQRPPSAGPRGTQSPRRIE